MTAPLLQQLATDIKRIGLELGFNQIGITDTNLQAAEQDYLQWLENNFHGDMDYMAKHGLKRSRPDELVPGTVRIISARLDYWPSKDTGNKLNNAWQVLQNPQQAYVSRYALGRDYHKVLRKKLQALVDAIQALLPPLQNTHEAPFNFRVFTDSAPVLEVALAEKAGIGWCGKHTLLINHKAGSFFFLGEIYTDLPLPIDAPAEKHCGTCTSCIDLCPTQAIVAPFQVDARRCISYLTIELKSAIPIELRPLIGNRVYGCDDCQLVCPWNKFAHITQEKDFSIRHGLDKTTLIELFSWDEATFTQNLAGSAIYRIGYRQWLRNLAVGLGNAPTTPDVIAALQQRANDCDPLVSEHVQWALQQHSLPR